MSSIVRTENDDIDNDPEGDGSFTFDEPTTKKTKVDLLKKPSEEVRKGVGQFAARKTLRTPIKLRTSPKRNQHRALAFSVSSPPIHDVTDDTPTNGIKDMHVGFQPTNIKQARAHSTWPVWKAAMDKERDGLLKRGTWTVVHRSQVPANTKIMGSQFIFKDKANGAKARLVVQGDQQDPKPTKDKTYSPTPSATEFRIIMALATAKNRPVHSCDIVQAFTQSNSLKPGEDLYVYPPVGYDCERGTVWKLRKPLYCLSIAPKAWFDTLSEFIF